MTAWTIESGAIASAATWKTHAPSATSMPTANHFERKRPMALATGCFRLTSGAAQAPRCFSRKPDVRRERAEDGKKNSELKAKL